MTASLPRLLVHDAYGPRVVIIDRPTMKIGRGTGNDIQLAAADVSREHADIITTAEQSLLRDRASRYGTFVNGVRVSEHVLVHGDRIECGRNGAALVFLAEATQDSAEESATAARDFRQVSTLLDSLRQMGPHRVVDEVLALVLDAAIDATSAERGFIMLAGASGALDMTLARGAGHVTLLPSGFATSRKIPEGVFESGEMAVIEDLLEGDLPSVHNITVALGIRHVLCVPLRVVRYVERSDVPVERRNIGVLYLDGRERGRLLSPAARGALEALAAEAALAIDNARLYEQALEKARLDQELAIASHVQRALLPQSRRIGTFFEAVGASIPSRTVSGDFFEYQDTPDGRFGFGIGDITGKGHPAALLAALVQGILAAESLAMSPPPEMMATINRVLLARPIESRFLTLFLAALAPDGRLVYCNAGHTPPLLLTASGVRRLDRGGTLVGAFENVEYEFEAVQLADGDTIVIVSDGVTEAMTASGDEFGEQRLQQCVVAFADASPEVILHTLLDAVRAFAGAAQSDDVTAVVVRYRRQANVGAGFSRP